MPNPVLPVQPTGNYNPRWFIWTIVFLVVSGVALVSYIVFSDTAVSYQGDVTTHKAVTRK